MFKVIKQLKGFSPKHKKTYHGRFREKQRRIDIYEDVITQYLVDTGHKNGAEVHRITKTGFIVIYNANRRDLVTAYKARPYQLLRYDKNNQDLIQLANSLLQE